MLCSRNIQATAPQSTPPSCFTWGCSGYIAWIYPTPPWIFMAAVPLNLID